MKKQLSLIMLGLLLVSMIAFLPIVAHSYTPADYETSIIKAANRLVALQSPTDYGWDWDVTGLTSHSAEPSSTNLYGVTAQGLIDAYELTGNAAYLTAAVNTGNFMKYGNPSEGDFWNGIPPDYTYYWGFAPDYVFLMSLSAVSGDPSYQTYALAAWTWQKANIGRYADGSQSTLWDHYANDWIGTNMYGAAALGTSEWGLAALAMGDTVWAQNMAVVIDANMPNILSASVSNDYKDMGMGWTLKFLVTLNPVTYESDIASLKTALMADQLSDGSWGYGSLPGDPQTTAYVVNGLWTAGAYTLARQGADWLVTNQQTNGGWLETNPDNSQSEYSETNSEPTQATFTVTSYASALYVSPSTVTMAPTDVDTNFTVAVTLSDFSNLMGFDLKLTWDDSLIANGQVDKTPLNALWSAGWAKVFEQSGVGFYELAVSSISAPASNTGASVLFTLTFQALKSSNFQLSTNIQFTVVKLSDNTTPVPNQIVPTTVNYGTYTMSGVTPDIEFNVLEQNKKTGLYAPVTLPGHFEANDHFEVQVYVTDISANSPLQSYDIEISFDHTLASFVDVDAWGVLGNGMVGYTAGSDVVEVSCNNPTGWSGDSGLLFTLTFSISFSATANHIWNYGNANNFQTFQVSVTGATLGFGALGTIGSSGITLPTALTFEVDFIRGDVDCDGAVTAADIGDVAYYYGKPASARPEYDLNHDGVIDIYDIVTIATNYGYGMDP